LAIGILLIGAYIEQSGANGRGRWRKKGMTEAQRRRQLEARPGEG